MFLKSNYYFLLHPFLYSEKLFGISMTDQFINYRKLNDDTIMDYLEKVLQGYVCILSLEHNNLTCVPELTHFRQLDSLG